MNNWNPFHPFEVTEVGNVLEALYRNQRPHDIGFKRLVIRIGNIQLSALLIAA